MDIKDVKVGDRCWVAWLNVPVDENGQNATVVNVAPHAVESVIVSADNEHTPGTAYPGLNLFWRKPEAPPKPKRKVTKEGWVNMYGSGIAYWHWSKEEADENRMQDRFACIHITWEAEE